MADIISYVTIAGTSYRYKKTEPSSGETWVLIDTMLTNALSLSSGDSREFSIDFMSNSQQFDKLKIEAHGPGGDEQYVYFVAGTSSTQVGNMTMDEEYRTITFLTSPTGDLLTWLQANGTKQGEATGHTLTWTASDIIVKVNGNTITSSPYALQNGDTIVIRRADTSMKSIKIITSTTTYTTDADLSPITISDTDITLEDDIVSPNAGEDFTINYTTGGGSELTLAVGSSLGELNNGSILYLKINEAPTSNDDYSAATSQASMLSTWRKDLNGSGVENEINGLSNVTKIYLWRDSSHSKSQCQLGTETFDVDTLWNASIEKDITTDITLTSRGYDLS